MNLYYTNRQLKKFLNVTGSSCFEDVSSVLRFGYPIDCDCLRQQPCREWNPWNVKSFFAIGQRASFSQSFCSTSDINISEKQLYSQNGNHCRLQTLYNCYDVNKCIFIFKWQHKLHVKKRQIFSCSPCNCCSRLFKGKQCSSYLLHRSQAVRYTYVFMGLRQRPTKDYSLDIQY